MAIRRFVAAALMGLSLVGIPTADGASAQSLRVVKKGTAATLDVPMNRAVVVESETPFAELSIANPSIADISSLSDRTIYVLGKSPGLTTLTLLDGSGRLITNVDVRVAADVTEFKQRLRQILPNEKIEVRTANDGIVLSGTVSSSARLQRALDLAERYAPERVSNLMSVGGVQQVMLEGPLCRNAALGLQIAQRISGNRLKQQDERHRKRFCTGGVNSSEHSPGRWQTRWRATSLPPTKTQAPSCSASTLAPCTGQPAARGAGAQGCWSAPWLSPTCLPCRGRKRSSWPAANTRFRWRTENDGEITIEFKPFGIELNFIPRVVDGDLINLELNAAVSAIWTRPTRWNLNGLSDRLPSRAAKTSTTVEMRDGESFAIAGLIRRRVPRQLLAAALAGRCSGAGRTCSAAPTTSIRADRSWSSSSARIW